MNIYLIEQDFNSDYDTFDSAVVVAGSAEEARLMHPNGKPWDGKSGGWTWAPSEKVSVKLIGTAIDSIEAGIICASFNAG